MRRRGSGWVEEDESGAWAIGQRVGRRALYAFPPPSRAVQRIVLAVAGRAVERVRALVRRRASSARSARPPLLSFPLAPSMKLCCGPRTQAAWCRAHSSPVGRRRSPALAQSFSDLGRTLSRATSYAPTTHRALGCTGLTRADERCREGDSSSAKSTRRKSWLVLSLPSSRPRATTRRLASGRSADAR